MNKNSMGNSIMMYAWLAIAILGLGAAIHKTIRFGFTDSLGFYAIALLAFALYYFRRRIKKSGS